MRWIHELPSVASGITADLKEFMEYGVFVWWINLQHVCTVYK
jgi:hypothetical protein